MSKLRRTYLTRDEIVDKLRKDLKATGLSREQWARKAQCSTTFVTQVLLKKSPPGPKILRALGIDPQPYYAITHTYETTAKTEQHDNTTGDTTDAT